MRDRAAQRNTAGFISGYRGSPLGGVDIQMWTARKQLDAEKKCINSARDQKYDAAIAAAKEGIALYPRATLARICMANVMITQKAPAAEQLAIAREIVSIDPRSRPGLAILASSYRALGQQDSAVVALTRLLATDPKNPRLQKDVVEELASVANPRLAKPVIDTAVMLNPGDPDLLRLRWRILLATRDYKEAFAQGDDLVKVDTSFADTAYFSLSAAAMAADSQFQKAAETAAKGLQKFNGQPSLTFIQIAALTQAGQNEQALAALTKAAKKGDAMGYHSNIEKNQDTAKWVQVDLGRSVALGSVVLHPCKDDFNGIGEGFGFAEACKDTQNYSLFRERTGLASSGSLPPIVWRCAARSRSASWPCKPRNAALSRRRLMIIHL